MQQTLSTCPKCGDPADDVLGRVCGHRVHEPHTAREDARLEVLANGGTMAEADLAGLRAFAAWLLERVNALIAARVAA